MDGDARFYKRPWFSVVAWVVVLLGLSLWSDFLRPHEISRSTRVAGVTSATFSADARLVVAGHQDGAVQVWESPTGKARAGMSIGNTPVTAVTFSPDGRLVAAGGENGSLRVWQADTGQEVTHMTHTGGSSVLVFSPDGGMIASGSPNGSLHIYQAIKNGQQVASITRDGSVYDIAFDANRRWALSGLSDGTLLLWNIDNGQDIKRMKHDSAVVAAAFSADRARLVSADQNGVVRVWDTASGEKLSEWKANTNVRSVAFSQDGRWVITGSTNGTARVWQVKPARKVSRFTIRGGVTSVRFSSFAPTTLGGYWVVSGGGDGTARVWESRTGQDAWNVAGRIGGDLLLIVLIWLLWTAFFAQFTLPLKDVKQRMQIVGRLIASIFGLPGAALFVENGKLRAGEGETKKRGAGVIWLDSASAAALRTDTAFGPVIGPGVHFTKRGQYVAGLVDLRKQFDRIGPGDNDRIFEPVTPDTKDETLKKAQESRMAVRGLTRDGIEVVPNISVMFSIDAKAPSLDEDHLPGSRFGFDAKAVEKAILGEAINAARQPDELQYHVAWNRLPILIAVDLWREYLSKFTLNELFDASRPVPQTERSSPVPSVHETSRLSQPVIADHGDGTLETSLVEMLHVLTLGIRRMGDRLDPHLPPSTPKKKPAVIPSGATEPEEEKFETAWQTILRMMNDRMKKEQVDLLDATGQPANRRGPSKEFRFLREHGVRVISVSVSNPRFPPDVERQLIRQWEGNWLLSAKADRDRLERLNSRRVQRAREQVLRSHAERLCRDLARLVEDANARNVPAPDLKQTLRQLLQTTRSELISNDKLHHLMGAEIEALSEIIHWLEANLR